MNREDNIVTHIDDVYYRFKKLGEPGWRVFPLEWMKVRLLLIIAYTLARIYNEIRK